MVLKSCVILEVHREADYSRGYRVDARRTNKRTNERTNVRTNERANERTSERTMLLPTREIVIVVPKTI